MLRKAVFIDLSNFYSRLVKSGIAEPRELRDYFLNWLDIDLLSSSLAGEEVPIWIFYSGRRLGSKNERIENSYLNDYIGRINRLPGVTAFDVEIPGEQREAAYAECERCHERTAIHWESEKGIDASLIVHLFDTADSWDHAFLLSGDADYTPAVRSLRRMGKVVSVAGFAGASSRLIREAFSFTDLTSSFIKSDFASYELFGEGKVVEQWLTAEVPFSPNNSKESHIVAEVKWGGIPSIAPPSFHLGRRFLANSFRSVIFSDKYIFDDSLRDNLLESFKQRFPDLYYKDRHFLLDPATWQSVERRLPRLVTSFKGTWSEEVGTLLSSFVKTPEGNSWRRKGPDE